MQIEPQIEAVCPRPNCDSEAGRTALGASEYAQSSPHLIVEVEEGKKMRRNLLKTPPHLDGFQLKRFEHGGTIQNGFQNITAN